MGYVLAIASIASAAYSGYQSYAGNKANRKAAQQAREDEENRRAEAQSAIDEMFAQYNAIREERDITIEEFMAERVKALNNEELKAAFRNVTKEDFAAAQELADEATKGNVKNFKSAADALSDGFYSYAVTERNKAIDSNTSEDAYIRSLQLAAPYIAAGSVDANGSDLPNRGEKKLFQTAYEVDKAHEDQRYTRLVAAIGDDRELAIRQQARAEQFMPFTSFTEYASKLHAQQAGIKSQYQLADESFYGGLIGNMISSMGGDQTQSPQMINTAEYDKQTSQSITMAAKALASAYA